MNSALSQPQLEERGPPQVVPLTMVELAAHGAAVRVRREWVELQRAPVHLAAAASAREKRLAGRNLDARVDHALQVRAQ